MTRKAGTELFLQAEEGDDGAGPRRCSPTNVVWKCHREKENQRDLRALNELGEAGLRASKKKMTW